jgi:hypothetical protein
LHALEFSLLLAEVGIPQKLLLRSQSQEFCSHGNKINTVYWLNKSKYIMKSELNLSGHVYKLGAILYKEQYCISFLMATRQKLFDLKDGNAIYCGKTCILYDAIAEENQCTKNKKFWQKHTNF